jgi:hypothetical protein
MVEVEHDEDDDGERVGGARDDKHVRWERTLSFMTDDAKDTDDEDSGVEGDADSLNVGAKGWKGLQVNTDVDT